MIQVDLSLSLSLSFSLSLSLSLHNSHEIICLSLYYLSQGALQMIALCSTQTNTQVLINRVIVSTMSAHNGRSKILLGWGCSSYHVRPHPPLASTRASNSEKVGCVCSTKFRHSESGGSLAGQVEYWQPEPRYLNAKKSWIVKSGENFQQCSDCDISVFVCFCPSTRLQDLILPSESDSLHNLTDPKFLLMIFR